MVLLRAVTAVENRWGDLQDAGGHGLHEHNTFSAQTPLCGGFAVLNSVQMFGADQEEYSLR